MLPASVLSGPDGREDLDSGGLDALEGLGKRCLVSLPDLDVVGGSGAGGQANGMADNKRHRFGFCLKNSF